METKTGDKLVSHCDGFVGERATLRDILPKVNLKNSSRVGSRATLRILLFSCERSREQQRLTWIWKEQDNFRNYLVISINLKYSLRKFGVKNINY